MSKQPETLFKEKVLPRLKALPNSWVVKVQQVGKSGTPDILMCLSGCFVAIELKIETGRTSKLQAYNLEKIGEAGGLAMVISPRNWDAAISHLEEMAVKFNVLKTRIWA